MLTREKLGYSGSGDLKYLVRDIGDLRAALDGEESPDGDDLLLKALECEEEAKRLGLPDVIAEVHVQKARVLHHRDRHDEAVAALCSATNVLGELPQPDLRVAICSGLAEAYAAQKKWGEASTACESGIGIVEDRRRFVSGQYLQSSFLLPAAKLYQLGVEAAYRSRRDDLMLARAELSKCRSVLRRRDPDAPSSDAYQEAERNVRDIRRKINDARATGMGEEQIASLREEWRARWDLMLIERSACGVESDVPDFDLAAVKAALEPDEAVLYYYWLDSERLLVVLIDKEDVSHTIQTIANRTGLLELCSGILEPPHLSGSALAHFGILARIDEHAPFLLPDSITQGLTSKHRRLLISPHQMLHAMPFHALPWSAEQRYLLERFAVTYIPNLWCLLMPYEKSATESLLVLGIEDYGGRKTKTGDVLSRIPTAEAHAHDLLQLYVSHGCDVTPLAGPAASKPRLDELERSGKLGTFDTLHFAVHGENVNSDTPMESLLELFDCGLEGLEIADWQLAAELVVLNACCSGQRPSAGRGLEELPGDDLFGLQAAFFSAGAKRIVCSMWPVDASIAPPIMERFHRFLLAGQPPEFALQNAVVTYVKDYEPRRLHRYFWAPFFLSAVGRPIKGAHW